MLNYLLPPRVAQSDLWGANFFHMLVYMAFPILIHEIIEDAFYIYSVYRCLKFVLLV